MYEATGLGHEGALPLPDVLVATFHVAASGARTGATLFAG
jgi:hypothetical protein